jgi:predicted Zn-ribbon and HTH transcriptional regulator
MRFIDPIPLNDLPGDLARISTARFRQMLPISPKVTAQLREIVDANEDRTDNYVREIRRIERFVRDNNEEGFAYPSWGRTNGFDWNGAHEYYRGEGELVKVSNGSPTDKWRCKHCDGVVISKALLKRCPACKMTATLVPEPAA